ncbi:MAG: GDSL-type esterase/lipase family protein [Chlorobiaceae bacterium]
MSWIKIRNLYGLSIPYAFEKVIPLLLSAFCFIGISLLYVFNVFLEEKGINGILPAYLLYLIGLSFIGLILSFRPKVSWFFLVLLFIESSLGFGTYVFARLGYSRAIISKENFRFKYHPVLQVVPIPDYHDKTVDHTDLGFRGRTRPYDGKRFDYIAVMGGSTTYDLGVQQGKTWPEMLEKALNKKYVIVNMGVPGYTTSEHVVQTAFYENVYGRPPKCVIYYIGWNDLRNAHLPVLDSAYADYHLISQPGNLRTRAIDKLFSPLCKIFARGMANVLDTVPYPENYTSIIPVTGSDLRLEKIFIRNIETISAINKARGIKTIFVAQILNREKLISEKPYGWLPYVRDKDVWPLQQRFNDLLRQKSYAMGDQFIDPGVDKFNNNDFVDNGHFSALGSVKFANILAKCIDHVLVKCIDK